MDLLAGEPLALYQIRGNTYSDTVFCFADTVVLLRIDTPFLLDRHSDFIL